MSTFFVQDKHIKTYQIGLLFRDSQFHPILEYKFLVSADVDKKYVAKKMLAHLKI